MHNSCYLPHWYLNSPCLVPFLKPYTIPDPDSTRDDLQYYEHDADPHDDWIVRTKKEWSGLPRIATHPLDLAVLRLANLERNIERRYLKEPLWNPAEVMRLAPLTPTPGEEHPMDVIRWAEGALFGVQGDRFVLFHILTIFSFHSFLLQSGKWDHVSTKNMATGSGSLPQRSPSLSVFTSVGEGHCLGEICD